MTVQPDGAATVALQAGGKIVVAGSARPNLQVSNALAGSVTDSGLTEAVLWSLNPRGSLLPAGSRRTVLGDSLGSGGANALAIDPEGRIIVFGASNDFVAYNGFGLRYHGFGPYYFPSSRASFRPPMHESGCR